MNTNLQTLHVKSKDFRFQLSVPGLDVHDVESLDTREFVASDFSFNCLARLKQGSKVPDGLIGKPSTLEFLDSKAGKEGPPSEHVRYFHGLIANAEIAPAEGYDGYPRIQLEIRPKFWFLNFTKDSRCFQDKTALEVAKDLLKEKGIDFKDKTKAKPLTRPFCVQYGESYFDFISRLLEESGIGYYFVHEKSKHVMVLFDDSRVSGIKGPDLLFHTMSTGSADALPDKLWSFMKNQSPASTKYTGSDYFFNKPTENLHTGIAGTVQSPFPLEVYDHPSHFTQKGESGHDADAVIRQRVEALGSQSLIFKGESTNKSLAAGMDVTVKDCPTKDFNGEYFVLSVQHAHNSGKAEDGYKNTFTCVPKKVVYRPTLIHKRPQIFGVVTAKVTGKKGEEVWADKYGAIKIKFYWDYRAKDDETSSCWVRVASSSASGNWGVLSTPRVGQDVLVQFEDGNPERPIVVSCLYNGMHLPPYGEGDDAYQDAMYKERSKGKIKSVWKTHSSPKGTKKTFNEITLTDDKGKEEVFVQAEKDYRTLVKDHHVVVVQKGNQEMTLESGDRKVTLEGKEGGSKGKGDDTLMLLKGSQTVEIKEGDQTLTIETGNQKITLSKGDQDITLTKGGRKVTIKSNDELKVSGNWIVTVDGKLSFSASRGIDMETAGNFSVQCRQFKVDADNIEMKAGMNAKIKGAVGASLEGMNTKVKGSVGASLEGLNTDVKGTAMVKVAGGMIMLN